MAGWYQADWLFFRILVILKPADQYITSNRNQKTPVQPQLHKIPKTNKEKIIMCLDKRWKYLSVSREKDTGEGEEFWNEEYIFFILHSSKPILINYYNTISSDPVRKCYKHFVSDEQSFIAEEVFDESLLGKEDFVLYEISKGKLKKIPYEEDII